MRKHDLLVLGCDKRVRVSFRDQSSVLTEVKNKQSDVNVASGRHVPSDAGCALLCPKQPAVVRLIRPTPVVVYFCLSLSACERVLLTMVTTYWPAWLAAWLYPAAIIIIIMCYYASRTLELAIGTSCC